MMGVGVHCRKGTAGLIAGNSNPVMKEDKVEGSHLGDFQLPRGQLR